MIKKKCSQLDYLNKSGEIAKNLYKLIDSQEIHFRNIIIQSPKILLIDFFENKKDEFSQKILQIVKS